MLCAIWTLQRYIDKWAWHHFHCTMDGSWAHRSVINTGSHFTRHHPPLPCFPPPHIHTYTLLHTEKLRHTASLEFHCKPTMNMLAWHQALRSYQNMSCNRDSSQSPEDAQSSGPVSEAPVSHLYCGDVMCLFMSKVLIRRLPSTPLKKYKLLSSNCPIEI